MREEKAIMMDDTNFLTKEQYESFLNAIPQMRMFRTSQECLNPTIYTPDDLRLLFRTVYEGAFRVSEALRLTPKDLIISDGLLKLENTKGTKKSKGRQKREFGAVKEDTFAMLVRKSKNMGPDSRFFPMTRQTVWRWARELGEIAGIQLFHQNKDTENMTVHTLRHSRAVHYVEAGQPLNIIQKKLRHRSLQPTTTYLSINIQKIQEVEDQI